MDDSEIKDGLWFVKGKPVKIDKWDGTAVKNVLDDAVKKVILEDSTYYESFRILDKRLIICTVAVGFALFALLWDWLHPFPISRPVLIFCVLSYFVMMAVLTLYTYYVECGIFLEARQKDQAGVDPDNIWLIRSTLKRFGDVYTVEASFTDGITGAKREGKFTKSIAEFFDLNGVFCMDRFQPEVNKLIADLSTEKKTK